MIDGADTKVGEPTPTLGKWWWAPSAGVMLALLILLVVPWLVERHLANMRNSVINGSEPARVYVNDLEAAFASELLLRNAPLAPVDTPEFARRPHLEYDEAELRTAVQTVGTQAVSLYADLVERLRAWDATPHTDGAQSAKQGLELLASAERLDTYLTGFAGSHRARARQIETLYVVIPAVLAPVALVAMILVLSSGRRVRRFALLADAERGEVVRASEARAALLRGVTHDVKNPLGAAAGYAQLLEEGVVGEMPESQLEMVRRIHRLVRASAQTVTDLLELARADGELHIDYANADLAATIGEVTDDHRGMAQERGIHLECSASPMRVVTDPVRVRQVLGNLLSNAIKYTPRDGTIDVRLIADGAVPHGGRSDQTFVGIAVSDTGAGIPVELQTRVFEEFFRVRNGDSLTPNGNGLGLAISRRIARLLGGDVTLAMRAAGGSVFTLWLPAAPAGRTPLEIAR